MTKEKGAMPKHSALNLETSYLVREENSFDLVFDFFFGLLAGDRDLFDDQRARGVEHAALAERQLLVRLQAIQIAQHLCHVVDRARLDLVHETAVAAVPGLGIETDRALLQDVENLADFLL